LGKKARVFSLEFKQSVARRIVNGESVSALHDEFQIKRSVLYRWRDAYRKEGAPVCSGGSAGRRAWRRVGPVPLRSKQRRRIAELERKIGQQALDLDFLSV
jgi:transposase-like protein